MKQIAPRIYRWTAPHPEWRTRDQWGHVVGSYALVGERALSLVDPLLPLEGDPEREVVEARLEALAAAAPRLDILITVPYHTRSAEWLYRRFRSRLSTAIWGSPLVAKRFHDPSTQLTAIDPGGRAGQEAVALPIGKPRRSETPLHFPAHKALAFGDAVISYRGELKVWQPKPFTERWYRNGLLPTLRSLTELEVDRVLVTHGEPVTQGGAAALAAALAAPPWDVSSS